jgi:O-antigen/teichoic acid export membrane protein
VAITKLSSRFFRNAAANWIAFLFVAIISFFLSPFVVQHLGGTAYGVWSLLVALVGYLGLLDFGVRGAVTRYVAHHHAVSDNEGSSAIVSAALMLFGFLGTLAILLSGVFAYLSPFLFNIPETMVQDARWVLVLGGLTVATTLTAAVFAGIVTGLERFDISSGLEIAITTIRTIAVVVALQAGHGLVMLGCIHLAASILHGLAAWITVKRIYPALRLSFHGPLKPHIKTIVSFSAFLSLIHVFSLLIYYSNALIIAAFLPIAAVTFFAIAGNLIDYAGKVAGALSKMMTPRVSALTSLGSKNVGAEVIGAAKTATLATAPIAATFLLRGESFVNLWMGTEYGPASGEILRVLALAVLLGGARSVAAASIIGANKHRTLIPGLAIEAALNIALCIALVRPLGIVGVAIGALVPSILVSVFFIPRYLNNATGIPVAAFYRQAWILPTLACVPFALASFAVERHFPASNLLTFFMQVISLLLLVPAGAWFMCLTAAERQLARAALVKLLRRGRN